jgi:hypothetical protein
VTDKVREAVIAGINEAEEVKSQETLSTRSDEATGQQESEVGPPDPELEQGWTRCEESGAKHCFSS